MSQDLEAELRQTQLALQAAQQQLAEERASSSQERNNTNYGQQQELEEERDALIQIRKSNLERTQQDELKKFEKSEETKIFSIRLPAVSLSSGGGSGEQSKIKVEAFLSDRVSEMILRTARQLGIGEAGASNFLYLSQSVNENSIIGAVDRFLDKKKTLDQEGINSTKCNLVLKFKHYKRHLQFSDPCLQEWFFKQLHFNIIQGYFPVTESLAVELAGLELQNIYGDATGKKRHSYFDKVGLDSYLPSEAAAGGGSNMFSHQGLEYWQDRLFESHKVFKGLTSSQARSKYIATFAAKSPFWGLTFFDIRDRENRPFLAGVGEDGLFIYDSKRRDLLASLSFEQLTGWEPSSTGLFVKKRGSEKMTLYDSSKLQSEEMAKLLDEYYLLLPQDVRDRLGVILSRNEKEILSSLPPSSCFESPIIRSKPVEFTSRLEAFKYAYIEHCMTTASSSSQQQQNSNQATVMTSSSSSSQNNINTKVLRALDKALDEGRDLEDFDISFSETPVKDYELAILCELFVYALETVTPQDIQRWRENINIRKLNVAHNHNEQALTEYSVPNICNFIRKFTRLSSVNLSYVPLDNRNESDVVKALIQLPYLETLVLRGCKIGTKGFSSISEIFSVVPSKLKTLDLEHNTLTQSSAMLLCSLMDSENCSLTSLNLGFNLIEVQGLESILATLKRTGCLSSFDFSSNPAGRSAPSKFADLVAARVGIVDLNLSYNNMNGENAVRLACELKVKSQIKKLNLSNNPIGTTLVCQRSHGQITRDYPAEFFSFLDVGVQCVLQTLIMDRCDLHEDTGQALSSALQNNTKLTELVLSNNRLASTKFGTLAPSWTDMIMNNAYLCKLDLSYNGITYAGLARIFAAMCKNRSFKELILDGNPLDRYPPLCKHPEVRTFLEYNSCLEVLSLKNTNMRDDFLFRLCEGLRANKTLKKLHAGNNEVTAKGVTEASIYFQENDTLEFLDLSCLAVQVNLDKYLEAYRVLIERSNLETVIL